MMKVFKMNECDWVCAENEQQAKDFYAKETSFTIDEINEEFIGEVPLTNTMFISLDDLPKEEMDKTMLFTKTLYGEPCVKVPFLYVIENEKITNPCIIASTEF